MGVVVLHGFMTKLELQDIQTHDHLSLYVEHTVHVSLGGDLLSVTSGWRSQQRG